MLYEVITWEPLKEGTPQGAVISPLLANIYLHYAFDLWAHKWREHQAIGAVVMVRYADDIIVGFESKADAERFRKEVVITSYSIHYTKLYE